MNNNAFSRKKIKEAIELEGYEGSDSLLRTYLAKIKKRIEVKNNKRIV